MMRSIIHALSPRHANRLSILIFHRVLQERDELFPGEVTAAEFDRICCWLTDWFNVLPMDEAVDRLVRHSLPARAACISFDDGYADNHSVALPILQKYGLSAAFFIATGFLDGGRMWNDGVIESIRRTRCDRINTAVIGAEDITTLDLSSTDARRRAISTLIPRLKYLEQAHRDAAVQALADQTQVELPVDLMMSSSQVQELRKAGMVVGAHTVTHPILARLSDAAAQREIMRGRDDLASLLGEPISLFAYPNGKPGEDYLPRDRDFLEREGFKAALSTTWGVARAGGDRYQLPRFTPWDRSRWRFGMRMVQNLAGARVS